MWLTKWPAVQENYIKNKRSFFRSNVASGARVQRKDRSKSSVEDRIRNRSSCAEETLAVNSKNAREFFWRVYMLLNLVPFLFFPQRKARTKMCVLLLILVIVAGVVTLIIVLKK